MTLTQEEECCQNGQRLDINVRIGLDKFIPHTMQVQSNKFTVTRSDAANLLEVSTRTVDRYIRSKVLSARKKGGNILLSEEELNNFKVSRFQNAHGASPDVPGRAHRHINNVDKILDSETFEMEEQAAPALVKQSAPVQESAREKVFEELYDLSRREIREYHNKLEASNYRLGQLETQLKHSVPLLEFHEQSEVLREKEDMVGGKMKHQQEAIEMLEVELKSEKLNKNIYIGLLFGLLALQPLLWLLLQ